MVQTDACWDKQHERERAEARPILASYRCLPWPPFLHTPDIHPFIRETSYKLKMIQTALIQNAHADLVTDAAYDMYGLSLATCGLDQRYVVKVAEDK